MKEGSGLDSLDGSGAMTIELEDLRHEKELQRDEIQKLQGQLHTLQIEIQVKMFLRQKVKSAVLVSCSVLLESACYNLAKSDVCSIQDLDNQAMTETESWREQQLQFEEQLSSQNKAKQEAEVELERCKQVMDE